MTSPGRPIVFLLAGVVGPGCGGGSAPATQPASSGESLAPRLETAHFRIRAGLTGDAVIREIADRLESQFGRVVADLEAGAGRTVTVNVWQDEGSFYAEMQRFLGQRFPATGYVTGADEIRVLAVPRVALHATHEFCHVASLWVNPGFANNPRWLWEAVALFENREFVDPRTLDYMVRGNPPTLSELDADPNASRRIYEVGYLIGEFVVVRWGQPALVRLIRSNGDVAGVLGLSPRAFEQAWSDFVRERYLS